MGNCFSSRLLVKRVFLLVLSVILIGSFSPFAYASEPAPVPVESAALASDGTTEEEGSVQPEEDIAPPKATEEEGSVQLKGNTTSSEEAALEGGDEGETPDPVVPSADNSAVVMNNTEQAVKISYAAHVAGIGWQKPVADGQTAGTVGKARALEALKVECPSVANGELSYRVYSEGLGWMHSASGGEIAGTTGRCGRVEALSLSLSGTLAAQYDVYYSVHVSGNGWLGWASNGQAAGAPAQGKQVEAVQIRLISKGGSAPGGTAGHYIEPIGEVVYSAHVSGIGWQKPVADGQTAGTVGKAKALEALTIECPPAFDGGITYQAHVAGIGWVSPVSNGAIAGTTGRSKAVEAFRISLTGSLVAQYDIYYRVHVAGIGWLDWASNGADAGSTGLCSKLEAIEIKLVAKGGSAPGLTKRPFVNKPVVSYEAHVASIGWQGRVANGALAGTVGKSKAIEALKASFSSDIDGGISYKLHVASIGWQPYVADGTVAGTVGRALQAEAVSLSLTGEAAKYFDIYYRVHSQDYGWLGWAKNGSYAGTSSCGYRMEAIQIRIVGKGASAPGSTNDAFKTTKRIPADRQAMQNRIWWQSSGTLCLIAVNRSTHKVGVFRGSAGNWSLQYYWSCVTGAPVTPTITGNYYTTGGKRGSLSTDSRAKYCTQIWGGYFFHTILASENELGKSLSHGCIRMSYPSAQWIYNNIQAGTKVSIYG